MQYIEISFILKNKINNTKSIKTEKITPEKIYEKIIKPEYDNEDWETEFYNIEGIKL